MKFKEYVRHRDQMMNEDVDMPPPPVPGMVRSFEQDEGKEIFKSHLADNLEKFNGDMKQAIKYATAYQPKEKDSPGFVKALKAAAFKHGVEIKLPSWLEKYDSPEEYHGFASRRPNLDKIKFAEKDAGAKLFQDIVGQFKGDMKQAIQYAKSYQPTEEESPGFVKALKAAAEQKGVKIELPSWLKKYDSQNEIPAMIRPDMGGFQVYRQ